MLVLVIGLQRKIRVGEFLNVTGLNPVWKDGRNAPELILASPKPWLNNGGFGILRFSEHKPLNQGSTMKIEDCKPGMRVISKKGIHAVIRGIYGDRVRISYGFGITCAARVLPESLTAINNPDEILEATLEAFSKT